MSLSSVHNSLRRVSVCQLLSPVSSSRCTRKSAGPSRSLDWITAAAMAVLPAPVLATPRNSIVLRPAFEDPARGQVGDFFFATHQNFFEFLTLGCGNP